MKTPSQILSEYKVKLTSMKRDNAKAIIASIKQAQDEAYNEAIEDVKKEKYNCEIALLQLTNEDLDKLKK